MRALVDDVTLIDHDDAVRELEGRAAVRDQDRRASHEDPPQRVVDLGFDPRVDGGRRVVEQQDPWVAEQRAGQCDPLTLAAGEREPLLADDRLVPVRETGDELVGLDRAGGGLDVFVTRVGAGERDVVPDGVGEQERVLEDDADLLAQGAERHVAHVDVVDADRTVVHVVEAGEQQPDRRLARSRRADEGDRLARRDRQGEVAQHRLRAQVAEAHVVERDLTVGRGQHRRVGLLQDQRRAVEQLEDAFRAGVGELRDRQHAREHPHRCDERQHVRREREEHAEGDVALQREPTAERQHRHHAERGDGLQQRLEPGGDPDEPEARPEQLVGRLGQLVELALLLPEALHDADARHGLLDDGGDLARELLGVPARREDALAQAQGRPQQRGRDEQHHERERGRQEQHDPERDHEHEDVADHDRQELQQALDQHDVGARPAHQLTGLHLVVAREVESLQLAEDRGAEVVLHRECDAATAEAADVRQAEARHPEDDEQQQPGPERLGGVGQHVVDDDLLDQRRERGDARADDRNRECGDRVRLVRRDPPDQPPDPTLLLLVLRLVGAHCWLRALNRARQDRVHLVEAVDQAGSVFHRVDQRLEPLGHRDLGRLERLGAVRREAEPDRPPVPVDRLAGQVPAFDQAVDHRTDAGLRDGQPPGEHGRPLVAGRHHRQHPVLGQRQVARGAFEHPPEQGERPGGTVQIVHMVSLSNGKASKLPGTGPRMQ